MPLRPAKKQSFFHPIWTPKVRDVMAPNPNNRDQQAMMLHTFRVQVDAHEGCMCPQRRKSSRSRTTQPDLTMAWHRVHCRCFNIYHRAPYCPQPYTSAQNQAQISSGKPRFGVQVCVAGGGIGQRDIANIIAQYS